MPSDMVNDEPSEPIVLSIDPNGATKLSVGGVVIGLIEELRVEVSGNLKPRIKVVFASTLPLPKSPMKVRILELLHLYHAVLKDHPCVEVFDTVETIPYMKAVRSESELPDAEHPDQKTRP